MNGQNIEWNKQIDIIDKNEFPLRPVKTFFVSVLCSFVGKKHSHDKLKHTYNWTDEMYSKGTRTQRQRRTYDIGICVTCGYCQCLQSFCTVFIMEINKKIDFFSYRMLAMQPTTINTYSRYVTNENRKQSQRSNGQWRTKN